MENNIPCDCPVCIDTRGFSVRQRLLGRLHHAAQVFVSRLIERAGATEGFLKMQRLLDAGDEKTILALGSHALSEKSGVQLPALYTEKEWQEWTA